ncbi:unnamed protein product [Cuscuta campestris]|uniref:Uncharacterized protein n=1 Tax=Cuscuta campestris TaxID=132261 RepID=A0A484KJE9_9ASTE|nr:unnamed protein product [Cuscuta campestris]
MDSISAPAPPFPLLVFFVLATFFLCLTSYFHFKSKVARTVTTLRFLLSFVVPMLVLSLLYILTVARRWRRWFDWDFPAGGAGPPAMYRRGGDERREFPWGLALAVVLLLVMVHLQIYIQTSWFPMI